MEKKLTKYFNSAKKILLSLLTVVRVKKKLFCYPVLSFRNTDQIPSLLFIGR